MPKTFTHIVSTSRKHTTGFLVKSVGECCVCTDTVLTTACYWPSNHCLPAQMFVSLSVELNHRRSYFIVDAALRQCCVLSPLFIVSMNWMDSHSRVDQGVTVGIYRINRLLLADDLVLFASCDEGLQHALGRLVLCWVRPSRNENQLWIERGITSLQKSEPVYVEVSSNTLQQVEKFKDIST